MEEIKISIKVPREKWGKLEKALRRSHCDKFDISITGEETIILVPNHKTKEVRENLVKSGIIGK